MGSSIGVFADPTSMTMALQMLDLSKSQLIILRAIEITINFILFGILVYLANKNNVRKMTIISFCIVIILFGELLMDEYFRYPLI